VLVDKSWWVVSAPIGESLAADGRSESWEVSKGVSRIRVEPRFTGSMLDSGVISRIRAASSSAAVADLRLSIASSLLVKKSIGHNQLRRVVDDLAADHRQDACGGRQVTDGSSEDVL
jgi:hypothetical protein